MSCKIQLTGYQSNTPGSTLSGIVACNFYENTGIREIRCILKGRERTWYKRGKTHYYGKNEFLLKKLIFHTEGTVEKGQYNYPFNFVLPMDIPCCFEVEQGNTRANIRYSIKATVDIPFALDYEDKINLAVTYPVDLNTQQGVLLGNIAYDWEEIISCWCFETGSASMKVTLLGKNAYIPGETVFMSVDIKNKTSTDIQSVAITLAKVTNCRCDSGDKERTKDTLFTKDFPGVSANSENNFTCNFRIPETFNIYSFLGAKLIDEDFRLRIEGVFPLFYENLIIDANLILGEIPLTSLNDGEQRNGNV